MNGKGDKENQHKKKKEYDDTDMKEVVKNLLEKHKLQMKQLSCEHDKNYNQANLLYPGNGYSHRHSHILNQWSSFSKNNQQFGSSYSPYMTPGKKGDCYKESWLIPYEKRHLSKKDDFDNDYSSIEDPDKLPPDFYTDVLSYLQSDSNQEVNSEEMDQIAHNQRKLEVAKSLDLFYKDK